MFNCAFVATNSICQGEQVSLLWTLTDIFSEKSFTLVDNGLSKTLKPNNAMVAHIISLGDFYIQSGAVLPIDMELIRMEEIERVLFVIGSKLEGKTIQITPETSAKLARATISTAIRLWYTDFCESLE